MKKKILFTAFNLDVGGVEKCLVNLVNSLDKDKYEITIFLQVKEGIYLSDLNKNIEVKGYNLSQINNRKINNKFLKLLINIYKYFKIIITNYHKYDVSICYAPGYIPSSILALLSSKKTISWMHTNILTYMDNYIPYKNKGLSNVEKAKKFIKRMFFRKYKKNIFVSNNALNAYLSIYPEDKDKCNVIYNIIEYQSIIKKSCEKINNMHDKFTFLNVGRQTEFDKRLSRIINAVEKLSHDNYDFKVIFVGDGKDTDNYKKLVKEKKLENYIEFIGKKQNPYPYFKLSDVFVLSSEFEGLPTTLLESLILNLPIITTNVSDAKKLIDNKYGLVVDNNSDALYTGMKSFLDKPMKPVKFDIKKYNEESIKKIESVIDNG